MSTFSICLAAFAVLAVAPCQPAPDKPAQKSELERLIQDLVADDAKVATEAQETLKQMSPDVVPILFDRLVGSGWDLKPALLEVLSEQGLWEHGLDWAKKKLLHGTDAEKTHAALLYELIDESQHPDTPEFRAMVEVLLKALDSEDKRLRAAAAFALVHDEDSTVFFQHLHRIVPALISSFDTDVCIWRGDGDPAVCTFVGISVALDCLIGDRMAYTDAEDGLRQGIEPKPAGKSHAYTRRALAKWLATQPAGIEDLRAYWQGWWDAHKNMTPTEIGKVIIERDLRLLEEAKKEPRGSGRWYQRELFAHASLERWAHPHGPITGDDFTAAWAAWWAQHKSTYKGPKNGEE